MRRRAFALVVLLALQGCPRGGAATATAPPTSAAPAGAAAAPVDLLERAKALLVPYDPGGSSRDGIEILLGLAKKGDGAAYALLARTYVDWTAYAAFAGDVPLLLLVERDLGVDLGPGASPFPLPRTYLDRLLLLTTKAGIHGFDTGLGGLIAAWLRHDLTVDYAGVLAPLVSRGEPAAMLWALMDCEESLRAATRVPSGLAPWVVARGCATAAPDAFPLLIDSTAADRDALVRTTLLCAPGEGIDDCAVRLGWPPERRTYATAESVTLWVALKARAALLARFQAAKGPLVPFARDALAPVAARRPELALTASFVPTTFDFPGARPALPMIARTAYGLWTDESRVTVSIIGSLVRLASKPVFSIDEKGAPVVDLGPDKAPWPGDEVALPVLAAAFEERLAAWEKRGYGGALGAGMPADPLGGKGARAVTLVADAAAPVDRVAALVAAASAAGAGAFHVLAARAEGSATEVPVPFALPSAPVPKGPLLELRVEAKRTLLLPRGVPGAKKAAVAHRGGTPDLLALYGAGLKLLPAAAKAHAALRATAARGVPFGDLWDAIDVLRYELPGGPFVTPAALDAARFASAPASAASLPAASMRRELGGTFTVVLEP